MRALVRLSFVMFPVSWCVLRGAIKRPAAETSCLSTPPCTRVAEASCEEEETQVVAYVRTSCVTNAGADRDSEARQLRAIRAHMARSGLDLPDHHIFYEPGVSGTDNGFDRARVGTPTIGGEEWLHNRSCKQP